MKRGHTKADAAIAAGPSPAAAYLNTLIANPTVAPTTLARKTGLIDPQTANEWTTRHSPVLSTWSSLQMETVGAMWNHTLASAYERSLAEDGKSWLGYVTGMGIATDKLLLLSGRPTQITAHLEEVRVTLPQLLTRIIEAERSDGPGVPAGP